jgi:O-antigen/teichoic acid export membrane protein
MINIGIKGNAYAILLRAARFSGLDWGVVYGSAARVWSMFTGAITVILIATFFSPSVQGFHYTFLSLTAVQVFFELGLTQVLIQFAAHEWSTLNFSATGHIEGDSVALSRLASLARFVSKWFGIASILFFVGILAAGWFSFYDAKAHIAWELPWLTLCIVVALDLATLPLWSLLEGCNQINSVYGLRFIRAVVGSLVFWIAISTGAGLWSLPISNAVSLLVSTGLLLHRYGRFFESLLRIEPSGKNLISWRQELWPMQWRIAVSWLAGYCYFSLFVPVLFKYQGPVVAGQMGMSWNVISAMITIPGMFIQTKVPSFGMLIAKRQWRDLDRLAFRTGISAFLVMLLGALSLFMIIWWLNVEHFALARRFLPLLPLSLFLIATIATQATSPLAAYLRAHRREPLMWVSVVSGLSVGAAVIVFGRYSGILGMAWSYLAISTLTIPAVVWIFIRCRSAWHV